MPGYAATSWQNPYTRMMGLTLKQRVEQMQQEAVGGHWASLRGELEVARLTLMDSVQFYAACSELPFDQNGRIEAVMSAGQALREAIKQVGDLAKTAAAVERELTERHDPAVTLNFVMQTVKVIDERLRIAEREGLVVDAEALMEGINLDVNDQVRLPADTPFGGTRSAASVTPATTAQIVAGMIDTVPEVA